MQGLYEFANWLALSLQALFFFRWKHEKKRRSIWYEAERNTITCDYYYFIFILFSCIVWRKKGKYRQNFFDFLKKSPIAAFFIYTKNCRMKRWSNLGCWIFFRSAIILTFRKSPDQRNFQVFADHRWAFFINRLKWNMK